MIRKNLKIISKKGGRYILMKRMGEHYIVVNESAKKLCEGIYLNMILYKEIYHKRGRYYGKTVWICNE